MFVDEEEIQELFAEQQERHTVSIQRESVASSGGRVFRPVRLAPQRRTRAYIKARRIAEIKTQLLAGERPKTCGRGRTATLWEAAAEQLGLDIPKRKLMTTAEKNKRDAEYRYRRFAEAMKARILAGERPKRPGSRWARAAKELGVDLSKGVGAPCST